jgi:asparagine N-glycosylation enzyme membrane subunit Stt3
VLFVVWSGLMYLATLGQNRFGYYLALCLAVLTGWACDRALTWAWRSPGEVGAHLETRSRAEARRAQARAVAPGDRVRLVWQVGVVALTVATFGVSAYIAWPMAGNDLGLSEGYRASLGWLRASTPEPFGDPDYYFASYRPGQTTKPAYTVMAWWDYGYEIMRLGRRVPVANPTQAGADVAGRFFTATDEAEGERILDQVDARYVIAHAEVPILPRGGLVQGKFETLVAWAGKDIDRYWESFLTRGSDGQLGSTTLFHAEYYRTLAVRLYVYRGAAAVPNDTTYVVSYTERTLPDGTRGKEILESRRFKTYEGALAYLDRFGHTGRAIVGIDPQQTPVPIEAVRHLRLVHESSGAAPPAVRIFEYSRPR